MKACEVSHWQKDNSDLKQLLGPYLKPFSLQVYFTLIFAAVLQVEVRDLEMSSLPVKSDAILMGAKDLLHISIKLHHFVAIVIPQGFIGRLSDTWNPLDLLPHTLIHQKLDSQRRYKKKLNVKHSL